MLYDEGLVYSPKNVQSSGDEAIEKGESLKHQHSEKLGLVRRPLRKSNARKKTAVGLSERPLLSKADPKILSDCAPSSGARLSVEQGTRICNAGQRRLLCASARKRRASVLTMKCKQALE